MKQLILLLFLLPFSAKSQCNAITVNTFVLKTLGNCRYQIEINATLSNGNASIKPFYTCGAVSIDLPDCFIWPTPSNLTFLTDTFVCCGVIKAGLRGHASQNCHGNQCIEIPLTNLSLGISDFNAFVVDDRVCLTWRVYDGRIDHEFYIQNSDNGIDFSDIQVIPFNQLHTISGLVNECIYRSFRQFYRIKVVDVAGNTTFSVVKKVAHKQNDLEYNTVSRLLTIKGIIDDFTPRYLTIFDRSGKELYFRGIISNIITLPQLPSGIYFVIVSSVKGNLVKTIIQ